MLKPLVEKLLGKWAGVFYALATAFLFAYPELEQAIPALQPMDETIRLILGALGIVASTAAQGVKTPGEAQ